MKQKKEKHGKRDREEKLCVGNETGEKECVERETEETQTAKLKDN